MMLGDGSTPTGTTATSSDWVSQILSALPTLASAGVQAFSMNQLLQYNLDQLKAGKQPLTSAQMSALAAGTAPQVNVGISSDVQNLIIYGLLGVGALVIGSQLLKRV